MPMRLPRGWRMGTWMNRTLVIVVAVSVFCSIGLLADEIPSGFDPGSSKAKGLILTFEDWPPDGVETDPFLQKLHSAGLNSPLKKASLTGFHATAKHIAAKAVSPSSETMRTI